MVTRFSIACIIPGSTAIRTGIAIDIRSSYTNFFILFYFIEIRNSFFVQAEFPAEGRHVCLLFHFRLFLVLSAALPQTIGYFLRKICTCFSITF